jgi:hypothetical protein
VARSQGQDSADPNGLSHAQREQEISCLKVGTADRVDDPEAAGRCPAGFEPGQLSWGDLTGVSHPEMEAAQSEPDSIEDEGHDGEPRRPWECHSDRFQDSGELGVSFVEVASDHELRRGAATELESLGDRGTVERGELFPRRLRPAASVRQGIGEP